MNLHTTAPSNQHKCNGFSILSETKTHYLFAKPWDSVLVGVRQRYEGNPTVHQIRHAGIGSFVKLTCILYRGKEVINAIYYISKL